MKIKVTKEQAARIAARLYPDDAGALTLENCMAEEDRGGLPCRICEDNMKRWRGVVRVVRKVVEEELNAT